MYYYVGTVTLKMPARLFWRTTPRKFGALCKVHVDLNDTTKNQKDKQSSVPKQPDAFVDQLPFM